MHHHEPPQAGYNPAVTTGSPIAEDDAPRRLRRRVSRVSENATDVFFKRSEEVLDYQIDLRAWLESGETVEGAQAWIWHRFTPKPESLFITKVEFASHIALVWLGNGEHGCQYIVFCRVLTSKSRIGLVRFAVRTRGRAGSNVIFGTAQPVYVGVIPSGGGGGAVSAATLSRASIAFGSVEIGASSVAETVSIINTGTAPLVVTSATAAGNFSRTFAAPVTLAAGNSASATVTFTPTLAGARTGTLTFATSAGQKTVALSGTGVAGAAISISDATITATIDPPPPPQVPIASFSVSSLTFPETVV